MFMFAVSYDGQWVVFVTRSHYPYFKFIISMIIHILQNKLNVSYPIFATREYGV